MLCCLRRLLALSCLPLVVACAPSAYVVRPPSPSALRYEVPAPQPASDLALIDARAADAREFHSGTLAATLNVGDAPIDPPQFLALHLQQELASRGVPLRVSQSGTAPPRLALRTFRIQNHRASGFSPYVTFTMISADLDNGASSQRLGVFIKRGKVPVMTFDEVVEPTFNQPLSLAARELASKVSNSLYGFRASDRTVDELIAKLNQRTGADDYLDVYSLGFTNNPRATETLVRLTGDADEYVRLAAISSLGNLRASSSFSLLKGIYESPSAIWQDRAMALKAIADLGTDQGRAFLADELRRWEQAPRSNESLWTLQLIRLYV